MQNKNSFYNSSDTYDQVDRRSKFIAKTYFHLLGAIVAFGIISILMMKIGVSDKLLGLVQVHQYAWLGFLGGAVLVSWMATSLTENVSSKGPQYLGLALYVGVESVLFSVMFAVCVNSPYMGVNIIWQAALITAAAFIALTGIVFVTRKDFSFMKSILMWIGVVAVIAILASILFGFQLGILFSVAMCAFAGGAILYETSNIIHHYDERQYIAAALSLFASVMLLFWYVLRIVMSLGSDD